MTYTVTYQPFDQEDEYITDSEGETIEYSSLEEAEKEASKWNTGKVVKSNHGKSWN